MFELLCSHGGAGGRVLNGSVTWSGSDALFSRSSYSKCCAQDWCMLVQTCIHNWLCEVGLCEPLSHKGLCALQPRKVTVPAVCDCLTKSLLTVLTGNGVFHMTVHQPTAKARFHRISRSLVLGCCRILTQGRRRETGQTHPRALCRA